MELQSPHIIAAPESTAELDRLGDEIAALATHLDAATARLLDLIREFDERKGWNNGSRSCAHWLRWRTDENVLVRMRPERWLTTDYSKR